jgi:hypothetical protein
MKIAVAILREVPAGRDYFDHDLLVIHTLGLAQIGGLAMANEGLEQRLLRAAADVELNITATGGAPLVVRRFAPCGGAGVCIRRDGQRASCRGRGREVPAQEPPAFDDGEPVGAEAASCGGVRRQARAALESVGRAAARASVVTGGEEATGYVDARVAPEFALALEHGPELNALGMSEEPGRIVILFAVDGGDANRDVERAAMPPKTAAWWRRQSGSEAKKLFLGADNSRLMAAGPVSHYVVAARSGRTTTPLPGGSGALTQTD